VSGPGSFVGGVNTCTYTGGSNTASCTVVITSAVAGTTVVSATSDIPTSAGVLTRTTNTAINTAQGGSGNASKIWIAPGNEGCTPGFWKNHPAVWQVYLPGQTLASVFTGVDPSLANKTLLEALGFQGGPGVLGAQQILLRAAVASLLNAAHSNIDFPRTTAEVIASVNTALASGDRDTILTLATALDKDNNLGCSIDAHGNPIGT
jgi:hypothetical protein